MPAGKIKVPDFVPQPLLKQHDASVLDLAFVMDCTGSMSSWITEAKQSIQSIVDEIVAKEMSDIRLALVEYRDHPPQDRSFVTRVLDFTPSLKEMQKKMNGMSASGGGDGPEAVADGLHKALNLKWRPGATKVCIVIADAPPHGLETSGDSFPKGCPSGHDPMQISRQMAEKNITLYSVNCGRYSDRFEDFFMAIAHMTGGQYVALKDAKFLSKVIVGGAREEMSLQQLMEEVNHEVMNEYRARGGKVDEDAMADRVEKTLAKKKRTAKALTVGSSDLPAPSARSKKIAELKSMADVKTALGKDAASTSKASTSTSRKRKLSTIRSPSPAKKVARTIATAKRRVISIDKDCTQTRSRSVCPRTGICTVCHPTSTSLSSGRGKKRTSLPVTMPIPTTARGKRRAHGTKSPVKTPSVRVSASTSTTPSGDVDLAIGKAVSRKQVRRLVKKSIAVNKLRKM